MEKPKTEKGWREEMERRIKRLEERTSGSTRVYEEPEQTYSWRKPWEDA